MKEIVDKIAKAERLISSEKGDFIFFGVFLRADSPDLWDLVIAADWLGKDKTKEMKYIVNILHKLLSNEERLKLSRIVMMDKKDKFIKNITGAIGAKHTVTEFVNCGFNNISIKHCFIITSQHAI